MDKTGSSGIAGELQVELSGHRLPKQGPADAARSATLREQSNGANSSIASTPLSTARILVVDDEIEIADSLAEFLIRKEGYRVDIVHDGGIFDKVLAGRANLGHTHALIA